MNTVDLILAIYRMLNDTSVTSQPYLTDGAEEDLPDTVQNVVGIACEVLITNDGRCNRQAMSTLREAGFSVTPGETDSFGWLSGCIHTPKGIVVYG